MDPPLSRAPRPGEGAKELLPLPTFPGRWRPILGAQEGKAPHLQTRTESSPHRYPPAPMLKKHNMLVQVTPSMAAAATPMAGLATSINPGSDLASLFECPVCFDYVLPPILQVDHFSQVSCIVAFCSIDSNLSFKAAFSLPPLPPQCHAGHLVCSNCRPKLTCCPTCRGQLGGNIRNLAMEKVSVLFSHLVLWNLSSN